MSESEAFYARYGKRGLDLLVSVLAVLILSPIMAILAALVYMNLSSPVFFRQQRPGQGNRTITVLKFRTMRDARDPDGHLLPDVQRLTSFGRFLRRSSLDELPQLFNVIRGDMSLVGPRPLLTEYLPYYTERENERHSVQPGIAGLAQVSGRNHLAWNERLEMDVYYVEHRSLFLDLYILLKTVIKVLKSSNVDEANLVETNLRIERSGSGE